MKKRDPAQDLSATMMLGCAGLMVMALGIILLVLMVAVLR